MESYYTYRENLKIDSNDILFLSQRNYFMSEIISDKNDFKLILIFFDDYIFDFVNKYYLKINNDSESKVLNIKKDNYLNS